MQIRLATVADRAAVVETTVEAFRQDPAFTTFFGLERYDELTARFAGHLFDRRVGGGSVWVGHDGQVAALWDRPDAPNSVAEGPGRSLELPAAAQARLDAYDDAVHDALPTAAHWYLGILACHPVRRGAGLARRVAEVGLGNAARDGVPAFLETTAPDNVRVYETAGWTVHAELADVLGLTVWVMRHEGRDDSVSPAGE